MARKQTKIVATTEKETKVSDDTYEELLDKAWDEIPEESLLPSGTWRLAARSVSYKPGKGDTSPCFLFAYNPVAPGDDVDPDAVSDLGSDYDVSSNVVYFRLYVETNRDLRQVRSHLEKHLGFVMPPGSVPETLRNKSLAKAFRKTQVLAHLGRRTYTDRNGEVKEENQASNFSAIEA